MLLPYLPFDLEESPLSYASRLAKFHVGDGAAAFLKDFEIKPQDMMANKEVSIARLAELSKVPLGDLRANVAVPVGDRTYDLRGELVSAEFLANPHTMFCPACLAEGDDEGGRRGRWLWTLSVVRTCPRHEIPLMCRAKSKWDDPFHELDRRVPERGDDLKALVEGVEQRPVSPLQEYVIHRLERRAGPSWLDSQTLDQATRGTQLLGVLVAFGPNQNLNELTLDDWDHAGRIGFQFTARGEAGINEALEAEYAKSSDARGTPGAKKMFGCLYNALASSKSFKDPGDIARILRDFISEHFALPAGTKVLKKPLSERLLHTVASLAKEQSLNSETLRNVLVAAKVIPKNAPSHFPIPVEAGREVASRMVRIVNVIKVPDELACSRPLVDQLFAERLLTPIYSGSPGISGRTQKSVDQAEIALLVSNLHANAARLLTATENLVAISKAAERAKVPAVTVVHMILGGLLNQVFCMKGEQGVAALRVDPVEIKNQAPSCSWDFSIMEAAGLLKLSPQIVWRLLDRHPEEVSMQLHWVICPSAHHRIPRIAPEEIADFKKRFIHSARIAEQCGLRVCEVESRLKRRGIRPALSEAEVGQDFYRTHVLKLGLFT